MTFDEMLENDFNTIFLNESTFAKTVKFSFNGITKTLNCLFDEATEGVDTYGNVIQYSPTLTTSSSFIKNNNITAKYSATVNSTTYKIKAIQHKDDATAIITLAANRQ